MISGVGKTPTCKADNAISHLQQKDSEDPSPVFLYRILGGQGQGGCHDIKKCFDRMTRYDADGASQASNHHCSFELKKYSPTSRYCSWTGLREVSDTTTTLELELDDEESESELSVSELGSHLLPNMASNVRNEE